jgi:hypothetical protein
MRPGDQELALVIAFGRLPIAIPFASESNLQLAARVIRLFGQLDQYPHQFGVI